FHERALAAEAGSVQRASHKLLACTALTVDEHSAIGRGRDGNLLAQRFHGHTVADHLVAVTEFASQQLIFIFEAPLLNGIANQDDDLFEGKRLLDEIEGAELCGSDSGLDRAVTGN